MSIVQNILNNYEKEFSLKNAYDVNPEANPESVRARIYESIPNPKKNFAGKIIDDKIIYKVSKGIYGVKRLNEETNKMNHCLLVEGNGLDLSFIKSGTVDAIITDHPYDLKKSNNGGNRHFAEYDCFQYIQQDFNEKARVLKEGSFLVEFLPEESAENFEYLYQIKKMAEEAGFKYYAKVPWKKGDFVSNCGRKSKNTEDVLIFSKGEARALRVDAKKDKAEPNVKHFMKGCNGMLPTAFDFPKPNKKDMLHQAEKPTELIETILNFITLPNECVLDQFAGSGVTGEACLNTKRNCILIEKAHEFVLKIQKRLGMIPIFEK